MLPGTGPYVVNEADVVKGKSVTIRRRNDYWAEKHRRNIGVNNFDEIREIVVRDQNLEFEMFKSGDLDYYYLVNSRVSGSRSSTSTHPARPDSEAKGLQRRAQRHRRACVQHAAGALQRHAGPRRRCATCFNRELMIEKLFFNEYVAHELVLLRRHLREPEQPEECRTTRSWRCSSWPRPGGRPAMRRGGWCKNGRPLTMELLYSDKAVRAVPHDLSGRSAQGRHHAEPAARHA